MTSVADLVTCTGCGKTYRYPQAKRGDRAKAVRCGNCRALIEVPPRLETRTEAVAGRDGLVVELDALLADRVMAAFQEAGARGHRCRSLERAREIVAEIHPQVVVVGVMLEDGLGTDLVAYCKQHHPDVPVVLAGSIFRHNRYRTRPATLHGADHYIDGAGTQQEILHVLSQAVPGWGIAVEAPQRPVDPGLQVDVPLPPAVLAARAQQEAPGPTHAPALEPDEAAPAPAPQPAQSHPPDGPARLAKVVLADLLLYNADDVPKGADFETFEKVLEKPLGDARAYMADRYPGSVQVLDDLIRAWLAHPESFHFGALTS